MPLDDLVVQKGWDERLLPFFLEMGKFDGKLYAVPQTYETLGIFYDKELFAENNWSPPKTIAELEILADEMLAKKYYTLCCW